MIFLAVPVGHQFGWGICGKYLTRELAALTANQVKLITKTYTIDDIGDELEFRELLGLSYTLSEQKRTPVVNGRFKLNGPLLTSIEQHLTPLWDGFRGTRTFGYTFFEENLFRPEWIENGRKNLDAVITGSSWCSNILRQNGLKDVHTVIQGVDPRLFYPATPDDPVTCREFFKDQFVIFSGGKFELRKGQDIVIRAVRTLQERHRDVIFINAWFNGWIETIDTMRTSPHIQWPTASGTFVEIMNKIMAFNGMDMSRVITIAMRNNALMPRIYHNSDLGIFPNRCEGGTNLVLMEFLACGKPVVATATTGHADMVHAGNALTIATKGETLFNGHPPGPVPIARWPEPDLDDAIDKLEWGYQHREVIASLGKRAGEDMAKRTWNATAREFLSLMTA